jgi:hypothetical protein
MHGGAAQREHVMCVRYHRRPFSFPFWPSIGWLALHVLKIVESVTTTGWMLGFLPFWSSHSSTQCELPANYSGVNWNTPDIYILALHVHGLEYGTHDDEARTLNRENTCGAVRALTLGQACLVVARSCNQRTNPWVGSGENRQRKDRGVQVDRDPSSVPALEQAPCGEHVALLYDVLLCPGSLLPIRLRWPGLLTPARRSVGDCTCRPCHAAPQLNARTCSLM